jgi:hypothetical protein
MLTRIGSDNETMVQAGHSPGVPIGALRPSVLVNLRFTIGDILSSLNQSTGPVDGP